MSVPIWAPAKKTIAQSNLSRFIERCPEGVNDYDSLYKWSVEHSPEFWKEFKDFSNIEFDSPESKVFSDAKALVDTKWFEGAKFNFAKNLLRKNNNDEALVFVSENKERKSLSYKELNQQVEKLQYVLKKLGVSKGDRVAGFLPNIPEAITSMLASSSLGAIWSSCSPDFGLQGVLDRFGQIKPKVLVVSNGYFYNGKAIDLRQRVSEIVSKIDSIEKVIVVDFLSSISDYSIIPNSLSMAEALQEASSKDTQLSFESLPFDHPLYIMYSSGTTGVPKCIVHGAGGTLIQHAKEHILHCDLKEEDTIFYFTTCGWMMWNWLVSALFVGAKVVLYDGSPLYREGSVLLDLIDDEQINVFGTSAKFISMIQKLELEPSKTHKLDSLRAILSTGSPLLPEHFDYVYSGIKEDVQLSSISGGTDIISCFVLGNPIAPVYRGEIQTRGLGMDVQIFNDKGESVKQQQGELVCKNSFPSMPIYFWNDPEAERYHSSYFDKFENIWCHGDWAELSENNGIVVYGRSDATLNPGGVRIGTAEIYRQVESLDEVAESIVVGQTFADDVRVVLFVKLQEGFELDEQLKTKIKQTLRKNASPRHVPAVIIQVTDIPRTISGKIVELAVKNIIEGRPVKNTDALANPEALEQYRDLQELKI